MNVKQLLGLTALALAAGTALAQDGPITRAEVRQEVLAARAANALVPAGEGVTPGYPRAGDRASNVTRAQVNQEVLQARAAGQLEPAGQGSPEDRIYAHAVAAPSVVTRAEVKEQVLEARANGEPRPRRRGRHAGQRGGGRPRGARPGAAQRLPCLLPPQPLMRPSERDDPQRASRAPIDAATRGRAGPPRLVSQLALRHERPPEAHLDAAAQRRLGLVGPDDLVPVVEVRPLQRFTVRRESHVVGRLVRIHKVEHLPGELGAVHQNADLRVATRGSRVEVHRADEDDAPVDDRHLGVQSPQRAAEAAEPGVLPHEAGTDLADVDPEPDPSACI